MKHAWGSGNCRRLNTSFSPEFLFRKIFSFLENEKLRLALAVAAATITAIFISGFGFADGGPWSPSWLYVISGAVVWLLLFLRAKPKHEALPKQEPQLLDGDNLSAEPSGLKPVNEENDSTHGSSISANTGSSLRIFLFRLSRLFSILLFLGTLLALLIGMASGELILAVMFPLAFALVGAPIVLIFNWLAYGKISIWLN